MRVFTVVLRFFGGGGNHLLGLNICNDPRVNSVATSINIWFECGSADGIRVTAPLLSGLFVRICVCAPCFSCEDNSLMPVTIEELVAAIEAVLALVVHLLWSCCGCCCFLCLWLCVVGLSVF